jgi:hypothetical protein
VHNGNPGAHTTLISSFVFLLLTPGFNPVHPNAGDQRLSEMSIDGTWLKPGVNDREKPGGKLNSPPGLKLGIVIPKAFGIVIKRRALMPLFLR